MTGHGEGLIVDSSVVVKWFLDGGEDLLDEAKVLLDAHLEGAARVNVLDLTLYEVGHVLSRKGFRGELLAAALDQLNLTDLGWLSATDPAIFPRTASLVDEHGLSFYDAAYVACAEAHGMPVVTADVAQLEAAQSLDLGLALWDLPG